MSAVPRTWAPAAAAAIASVALLAGCAHRGGAGEPAATRVPGADGTVLELRPVLVTARSEYYALTYWSSGLRISGFLGRPRDRTAPRPAVILNRGGDRDLGPLRGEWLIRYVEAGYVAVGSQYRGGPGSEGEDEFGGRDVEDVLNLIVLLKARPEVDPARIAMVGWSRGGMMTYRALQEGARRGRNDIRVAASVGGMADLDILDEQPEALRTHFLPMIGCAPWDCPEPYRARSAVQWASDIHAPLLLLHGEADERVPVEQSRRLAALLSAAGRLVKLVTFPGEDHELTHHQAGDLEILQWFGTHLGVAPENYSRERLMPAWEETLRAWPKPADADPASTG